MFYYLKGKVVIVEKDFIVLDVGGVGYKINISDEGCFGKNTTKEVTVYCYVQKTDNDTRLYGFEKKENLELFEKLIKISGVGPKTALPIASSLTMEEIKKGIETEDKQVLKKIFGIGKKKGQQVVFELSRKFIKEAEEDEVFETLKELGFCPQEIHKVLAAISEKSDSEKRIKEALKVLGKK